MMRWVILMIFVMALWAACAKPGTLPELRRITLEPLHGSSTEGVQFEPGSDELSLRFNGIPEQGVFLGIDLPEGMGPGAEIWSGDSEVLHLIVATADGAELGVVPLSGYRGGPVSLHLKLTAAHDAGGHGPPSGDKNQLSDLAISLVSAADPGPLRLEWTYVNVGDYDSNGEVNIADLTPIGQHFGKRGPFEPYSIESVIDGDDNEEINISDLTPIGAHFGVSVIGYVVRRNGFVLPNAQGNTPTLELADFPAVGAPPRLSVTLEGSIGDRWSVAPVDSSRTEGQATHLVQALRASLDIEGVALYNLEGEGQGGFDVGRYIMRIVNPGFDIHRWEWPGVGNATPGAPGAVYFNDLPRGQLLVLDFLYAPTVDLATGGPADEEIIFTSIPFVLPLGDGQDELIELNAGISMELRAEVSYDVVLTTEMTGPNSFSYQAFLDYTNSLLSIDTDGNGNFGDEAQLADDDRDSISAARIEQERDNFAYRNGERKDIVITGAVNTFNEATGFLVLAGAVQQSETGDIPLGTVTVRFSEVAQFEERVITNEGETVRDFDPSTLALDDVLEILLYSLDDPASGLPLKYWAQFIERQIDQTGG